MLIFSDFRFLIYVKLFSLKYNTIASIHVDLKIYKKQAVSTLGFNNFLHFLKGIFLNNFRLEKFSKVCFLIRLFRKFLKIVFNLIFIILNKHLSMNMKHF